MDGSDFFPHNMFHTVVQLTIDHFLCSPSSLQLSIEIGTEVKQQNKMLAEMVCRWSTYPLAL